MMRTKKSLLEESKKRASKVVAGFLAFTLAGCSYIKGLEKIVIENQGTINVKKEKIESHLDYFSFSYDKYLPIDKNRRIHVRVYEPKETFANVILLPTLGEPASSLEKFAREFSSFGYRIYAVDIEGFGESSGQRGCFSIPRVKEDISRVIEEIEQNKEKIVLCGTSIGSEFSLIYGIEGKYKDKISAIILHACFAPFLDLPDFDGRVSFCKFDINRPIVKFITNGKLDLLSTLNEKNFYNNLEDIKQIKEDKNYVLKIDTDSFLNFLNYKLKKSDLNFNKPVLMIVSKDDKLIPFKHSIELFWLLRKYNKRTILYIPSGIETNYEVPHMAFDTNYKEITKTIDIFLKRELTKLKEK